MSEKLSMNNKKRSWINQKDQEEESYPKTINFPARSLCPPPPSSPSCTQEGRSVLERGVQNSHQLSPTVIKPLMYPWKKWSLQREVHILLPTSPSPFPSTHTHTHACAKPLIHPWVEFKFTERGIFAIILRMTQGAGTSFQRHCGAASVGDITRLFGFVNWIENVNWPPWKVSKEDISSVSTRGLTFQMLA